MNKISRILTANGFMGSPYEPFLFTSRTPVTLSINNIRFSNVNSVYLGEEALTVNSGKATVFYNRITDFHIGGERRI
jgi:hypothetical protein